MKRAILPLLFVFFSVGNARLGAQEAGSWDKVRLKDGRTVSGRIVEEHAADLVMLVRGIRRTYDRAFITGVSYGAAESGDQGGDDAVPTAPSEPGGTLVADLALRYRVPVRDVLWVRSQGVGDADLPLVFLIAATAGVTPRRVMGLVHEGWTWARIEDYFQMRPDAVAYEPVPLDAYPYDDPDLYVGPGWNGGWGYGYDGGGWGAYGAWGYGRGNWGGGHGNWGAGHGNWRGRGDWGGASSGGRVPIGASREGGSWTGGGHSGGGSWSGAGRVAVGGGTGGDGHR